MQSILGIVWANLASAIDASIEIAFVYHASQSVASKTPSH